MNINPLIAQELIDLREMFVTNGVDIRLVGGCVRDMFAGVVPKDIDLCTDATPKEQVAIYQANNIRYIETGLRHGTVSVVLNGVTYEITSLRTDVETNGRHATVAYTRDWLIDAQRRDFTINAMALTFDGELIDPFNGLDDLRQGLVMFVGDAEKRIQEDYLRILRFFRFRGRFGMSMSYSARRAIYKHADGLEKISRERVWSEISKILAGNNGPFIMGEIHQMDIGRYIGMTVTVCNIITAEEIHAITRNPVTIMVALYEREASNILRTWKASRAEIDLANFLSTEQYSTISPFNWMAVSGISREWAMELAALRGMDGFDRAVLSEWEVPVFPITGDDIITMGVKQGPEIGRIIFELKNYWAKNKYLVDRSDLLNELTKLLI